MDNPILRSSVLMTKSVSTLYQLAFLAAFILFMALLYCFGVKQWQRKVTDKRAKGAGSIYYVLLILAFSVGTIARIIQELTGSEWAEALVPIFGGVFMLAIGWPLIFLPRELPPSPVKRMLSWTLAIFITLIAITFFGIGFTQMLSILQ